MAIREDKHLSMNDDTNETEFPQSLSNEQEVSSQVDRPTILIVDDNIPIQEMLYWLLESMGYRAIVSAGGQAVLTWIDTALQADDCPGLILLDLGNPSASGADLLHLVRARWNNTSCALPPIIVLTTSKNLYENLVPVERVLLKPFHVSVLTALVQEMFSLSSH